MTLKQGFVRSSPVSLMSLVMGGFLLSGILAIENPAFAQSVIVPDNTLGNESSNVIGNFNGLPVEIIVDGAQRGRNLFHSFREFSVGQGRGAYFFSPDAAIQNILARVTGANRSDILGTLGTFGNSQPNLFLINPNGIIFGRNASLDLGRGSFYGTTASGIKFGEMGEFSAVNPQSPPNLLTINPSAFFFTARPPGAIVNQSQASRTVLGGATLGLQVRNGRTLLLLGGNVTVDGGILYAPGGRVEIGAIADTGIVDLNSNDSLQVSENIERGDVAFTNDSLLVTEFDRGGEIAIAGKNITISQSRVSAGIDGGSGTPENQAGDLKLDATDTIRIQQGSEIFNLVYNTGNGSAGNIDISTGSLFLSDRSFISASVGGTGKAGNLTIQARDLISLDSSGVFSIIFPGRTGQAQDIQISAGTLLVKNGAQISTSTLGRGNAGNIILNVQDQIVVDGVSANGQFPSFIRSSVGDRGIQGRSTIGQGGNIQVNTGSLTVTNGAYVGTFVYGTGNAGSITIAARDQVIFDGFSDNGFFTSRVTSELFGTGQAGNIQITTGVLEMTNDAFVSSRTSGIGNAGNVSVYANDRVVLSGNDTTIDSSVRRTGRGQGGDVRIFTNNLELSDGAQVIASTLGFGNAGDIIIEARDRISLIGSETDNFSNTAIFSGVGSNDLINARGEGGNIQISANTLEVWNAQISVGTYGIGNAGSVLIDVRDRAIFRGDDTIIASRVEDTGRGQGGNIRLAANTIEVLDNAALNASTLGIGNSGNVTIAARDLVLFDNSSAFSAAVGITQNSVGNAGSVRISANQVTLRNSSSISSSTVNSGNAGDVYVTANTLDIYQNTELSSFTGGGQGNAGNVIVEVRDRVSVDDSIISTRVDQTSTGRGGNIQVRSGAVELFNNASLDASTSGGDRAGNIAVEARDYLSIDRSNIQVFSDSFSDAGNITIATPNLRLNQAVISAESAAVDGGNINLNVGQLLLMRNGSLISATAGTAQQSGNGGNITINAPNGFIVGVKSENSDITANAFTGSGGRVNITAQGIFGLEFRPQLTALSDITASSTFGASGVVTLNTPNVDPSRGLVQLPQSLIDTNRILANSCIVRDRATGGIFLITGTGGLPIRPGDPPLPVFPTGDVQGIEKVEGRPSDKEESKIQNLKSKIRDAAPIVEAQGIYRLPDGQLILSWECDQKPGF